MPLKLNSAGGGSVTIDVPSTASNFTLNAPANNGTLISSADSNTVTQTMIATAAVTPVKLSQPLTAMTPLSTASGTTASFTSIPSWVKRITIGISNFSNDGTNFVLALGYGATTYVATGYLGCVSRIEGAGSSRSNYTTNFILYQGPSSTAFHSGVVTLVNTTGNTWAITGNIGASAGTTSCTIGGHVDVGAVLTALQFSGGTFDSGTISVMYE